MKDGLVNNPPGAETPAPQSTPFVPHGLKGLSNPTSIRIKNFEKRRDIRFTLKCQLTKGEYVYTFLRRNNIRRIIIPVN